MNRKRLLFLIPFCLFVVGLGAAARAQQTPRPTGERPNIVFVLADDLRHDIIGVAGGHPLVKTPHLDKIAREGAWLRQACVVTPLCAPSRAAFLTGLYGHTSGFRTNNGPWPESFPPSFLSVAQSAGYRTAFIGKKHLYNTDEPLPGMDRWVSFVNQGLFVNPLMNVDGTRKKHQGANGDLLTDFAATFIRESRGKPFALVVAYKEAHSQQTAPPRFDPLFEKDEITLPATWNENKTDKPRFFVATRNVPNSGFDDDTPGDRQPPPGTTREQMAVKKIKNYYRNVAALDDYVGRLQAVLAETGQIERTIFVFSGDNGYFLGEHGRFEKMTPHEESVRVPFLIRYPAVIKPGTISDAPVLNIDLAPTLYDLAGLKGPAKLDGRSLRAVLSGQTGGSRQDVYLEWQGAQGAVPRGAPGTIAAPAQAAGGGGQSRQPAAGQQNNAIPTWRAVRTPTHKYAVYLNGDLSELYDLKADPKETRNLINEPSQKARVDALHRRLRQLADETNDPLKSLLPTGPSLKKPAERAAQ